jgi:heme/copper-type cytochrome/quinol oxidase subunit 2
MTRRPIAWLLVLGLVVAVSSGALLVAQAQNTRTISVTAKKYTYVVSDATGPEIRVKKDDLVTITLTTEDIAHTFTISDYRIDKRVEPGKPVTFSFRADLAGSFDIKCTLTIDERCARDMKGKLIVVKPPQPRR